MLGKKAIEEASEAGFTSHLFTVPKKTADLRPVLNLRPLNKFIPRRAFKMETMVQVCRMVKKGDWMTSIDLQDAFLHILVHPSSRRFLQFQWNGTQYQFRVLPFGLSLSPLLFTKILKPVLTWARKKGIRVSAYLDDLIILASSVEESQQHTRMLQDKLQELGFLIKDAKSTLTPTQRIDHLGFTIDTTAMTLSVPRAKVRDIRREANKLLRLGETSLRSLSAFIGKAMAMLAAVFPARLQTRRLTQLLNSALKTCSWTDLVKFTDAARQELQWWSSSLQK